MDAANPVEYQITHEECNRITRISNEDRIKEVVLTFSEPNSVLVDLPESTMCVAAGHSVRKTLQIRKIEKIAVSDTIATLQNLLAQGVRRWHIVLTSCRIDIFVTSE